MSIWRICLVLLSLAAALLSTYKLAATTETLRIESFNSGSIPITVFQRENASGPLVILVHGFAGSRPLMQPFAVTLARNGFTSATFDLSGHGRNRSPLTGDLTKIEGATRVLVDDVKQVVAALREKFGDAGPVAVLGHSMSSDIAVRFAQSDDNVVATIGVSLFSPAITASSPRNLLIINGALEGRFKQPSRELLSQLAPNEAVQSNVTYGSFEAGNARKLIEAKRVEHVGVLFSAESTSAALQWLHQVFELGEPTIDTYIDDRGGWIILLVGSIVLLWWGLIALLHRLPEERLANAQLRGLNMTALLAVPMIATPLLLHLVPTDFLPVLVGDYLALHFLLYGVLSAGLIFILTGASLSTLMHSIKCPKLIANTFTLLLLSIPLCMVINWQIASFIPPPERMPLLFAVLPGTLCWFLADEWAMREQVQWRFAYITSKVTFLLSLGIAVALDFEGLFFLLLIVPIMVPLFLVFGLLSRWSFRASGSAMPAAFNNAIVFAWAIGCTFPLVQ